MIYDAIIIGGGIAGMATDIGLTKYGLYIKIIERTPGMNPMGAALGIFPNGLTALN